MSASGVRPWVVVVGVAAVIAACGGRPATDPKQVCEPGRSVACACTNGLQGAQACAADGQSWDSCVCGGPTTGTGGNGGMSSSTGTSGGGGISGGGGFSGGGSGGAIITGGGGAGTFGMLPVGDPCFSGVKNKAACAGTESACFNTCGPLKSGFKNCSCVANMWSCPTCAYLPGDYSCFRVNATIPLCPPDATDPTGAGLPQSGASCNMPTCSPCGSNTSNAYRDATGTPRLGFCVCSAADGTGTYSCASLQEWPPQQ